MYEQYLFPLNEMYYGKHPLLKMIEKYFDELRRIINVNINNAEPKKIIPEDDLPEFAKKKLLGKRKNSNLKEAVNHLYNSESKYKKAHEYVKHIIRTSNTARIALGPAITLPEPTEKDLKEKGYRKTLATMILPNIGAMYFEPILLDDNKKKYYVNLIKNICEAWQLIFKFPGVTLDILEAPYPNAFYFPGIDLYKDYKTLEYVKEKPLAIKKWINKNRLQGFGSDNKSIYFKKVHKSPVNIFITTAMILRLTSAQIVGILLHEIGHSFGFKLLPIEYINNAYVQEKFADAFATKFGYSLELIGGLKYLNGIMDMNNTTMAYMKAYNGKIPSLGFVPSFEVTAYLKIKILLSSLLSKYDKNEMMRGGYKDPHPTFGLRYKEQLKHLVIELNNPRLNNIQKRQLKNNIETLKLELSPKDLSELDKFMQDVENEMNIASAADEYKANVLLNPKIIRDILDQIYDQTLGKG